MNAPSNVPAVQREPTRMDVLKANLSKRADEFKLVLPAHITPEKFQRVVATAALQNPQLLECDRQSLLLASMKLAQDGLLPDGREAALVPFKVNVKNGPGPKDWGSKWQVQPMPMVYGLRKKILQSGDVLSIETGVVYLADLESGHFLYEVGMEPPIRYRPNLLLPIEDTTDDKIVAAYSIAKIKNEAGGQPYWSVEVMRRAEIDKVRQASQTGATGKTTREGKAIPPKGPWVDWFGEMARKTVLRRHAKVLPMSGDILETFERDIEAEREADHRAAESAAAFLSVEPREPVTLPTNEELAQREGVDLETGEVLERNPATGMTEVDEETARRLDANDGTLSEDNPTAAEGRADEDHGDQHDGSAGPTLDQATAYLKSAGTIIDLNKRFDEVKGHFAGDQLQVLTDDRDDFAAALKEGK
ncbi:recombinase RecT [Novosphingobium sp.]|uniref:recombinase RecT n=1 Tax=Novosphingobium sp. TaxID=1874826 RepID=UPI00352B7FAA